MTKAIIGKKLGMSRIFDEKGNVVPVTLISAQSNVITQVKDIDTDGYAAIQIGLNDDRKINQPMTGHQKKANIKTRTIKEFKIENQVNEQKSLKLGDKIEINQFEKDDIVSVQSISKGKGFSGTVKRHNFTTGPKTHGSNNYRQPGSIGSMYPQRVIKGRRMAGHMGHDITTVKNLKIVSVDIENKIIMLRGAVPGFCGSIIYISK